MQALEKVILITNPNLNREQQDQNQNGSGLINRVKNGIFQITKPFRIMIAFIAGIALLLVYGGSILLEAFLFLNFTPRYQFDSRKKELDISNNDDTKHLSVGTVYLPSLTVNKMIEIISKHKNITIINLSHQKLKTTDLIRIFQCLQNHSTLKSIDISSNYLSQDLDEYFVQFIQTISATFPALTHFNVACNDLNDQQAIALVAQLVQRCPAISYIGLMENNITGKAIDTLAKYPITINLYGNPVKYDRKLMVATEWHESVFRKTQNNSLSRTWQTKVREYNNPIKAYQKIESDIDVTFPTLCQLSIFKIRSNPELLTKIDELPPQIQEDLQRELQRNIIF